MKKQLLSALLAFATTSCFGSDFIESMKNIQQPTKAELLRHLNYEGYKIIKKLEELSVNEKELEQKFGSDYIILTNILNDFFELTQRTKEYSKLAKTAFYLTCHYMIPINYPSDFFVDIDTHNFIFKELKIEALNEEKINFPKAHREFLLMTNILLTKYCHTDDIKKIEERINYFFYNNLGYGLSPLEIRGDKKILTFFLEDIENKIKELKQI